MDIEGPLYNVEKTYIVTCGQIVLRVAGAEVGRVVAYLETKGRKVRVRSE